MITSAADGQLTKWSARTGDTVKAGTVLGVEKGIASSAQVTAQEKATGGTQQQGNTVNKATQAGVTQANKGVPVQLSSSTAGQEAPASSQNKTKQINIEAPMDGTVLTMNAISGQMVTQGQPLAMVADMENPYILAYIDEDRITDVSKGQEVDVYLDAYPGTKFRGEVSSIGDDAGNFLEGNNSSKQQSQSTFTKEVQRIPVKITVNDFAGDYIALGMNATVKIHK
jgi:multidrug resistance efflux pump